MDDGILSAFKVCWYRTICSVYQIYNRCNVGIPKVADVGPRLAYVWLVIGVLSARYHADRFVGIADTGPIMTRFIGLTMGRTTTKDVEPTRQADIFPMPLKRQAAAARMISDIYVLAGKAIRGLK